MNGRDIGKEILEGIREIKGHKVVNSKLKTHEIKVSTSARKNRNKKIEGDDKD